MTFNISETQNLMTLLEDMSSRFLRPEKIQRFVRDMNPRTLSLKEQARYSEEDS